MTKILKYEEIAENLCIYDDRNPNYFRPEVEEKEDWDRSSCFHCGNCAYGRTPMAQMLLVFLEGIQKIYLKG